MCCDMVTCLELWEHSGLQLAWTVHVPTPRLDTVDTLTTSERPGCQDHRRHSLDTLDTSTPVSTDTPSTLPRHSLDTVDTVDTSTHQGSRSSLLHRCFTARPAMRVLLHRLRCARGARPSAPAEASAPCRRNSDLCCPCAADVAAVGTMIVAFCGRPGLLHGPTALCRKRLWRTARSTRTPRPTRRR